MWQNFLDAITGKHHKATSSSSSSRVLGSASAPATKLKATVVLMKRNVLDFSDFNATLLDGVHEFLGKGVAFHLVSATVADPSKLLLLRPFHFFLVALVVSWIAPCFRLGTMTPPMRKVRVGNARSA